MSRHRARSDDDTAEAVPEEQPSRDTGPLFGRHDLRAAFADVPQDVHPEVHQDVYPDVHPDGHPDAHPDLHPDGPPDAHEEPGDGIGLLPTEPVPRHPVRERRARPARRGRRRPLGIVVSLGVIAALVTGIYFGGKTIVGLLASEPAADYAGQGTGTVEIEVPEGASTVAIAEILVDNDVVASAQAFVDAATANVESLGIQPGVYQMRAQMSAAAALARLLDPASRVSGAFTIPEGYTVARTLQSLAEQTGQPLADFQAAAAAPEQLGLPVWANGALEGFIYPDTYDLGPDATAVEILAAMVERFNQVAAETGLETRAAALGLTPYDVLTVASLVQSEVTVESERPMVARVIYNRLAQGIALGIDAALAYELGINGSELTTEVLQRDSPYNTRTRTGLPPTPISNPGRPSIMGALEPADGNWLYYVLQDSAGNHLFTASYEEFLAAKAACEAQGLGCG